MEFLVAAFELVQFGWKVFPLSPGLKIPAVSAAKGGRGCLDATDDEEIIAEWAREYPRANVGLACGENSGIIVVDFDPRNGCDQTLKQFASRKKNFLPTVEVRTWSGGTHLYYRWEPEIKNSKSKIGQGIDVKTTGGYVVAPPSRIRCKDTGAAGRYEWIRSPLGGDLPRLPRWAVEFLKIKPETPLFHKKLYFEGDLVPILKYIESAPKGQRNNILHWGACRAAEKGALDLKTRSALLSAAIASGLSKLEAEKTIASAFAKAGHL